MNDLGVKPPLEKLSLAGPACMLNVEGTAALLTLGARIVGPNGVDYNTMEHLLGTDSRNPRQGTRWRALEFHGA